LRFGTPRPRRVRTGLWHISPSADPARLWHISLSADPARAVADPAEIGGSPGAE